MESRLSLTSQSTFYNKTGHVFAHIAHDVERIYLGTTNTLKCKSELSKKKSITS